MAVALNYHSKPQITEKNLIFTDLQKKNRQILLFQSILSRLTGSTEYPLWTSIFAKD